MKMELCNKNKMEFEILKEKNVNLEWNEIWRIENKTKWTETKQERNDQFALIFPNYKFLNYILNRSLHA